MDNSSPTPQKEHPLARLILSAATLIALVVMVVSLTVKGTRNEMTLGSSNDHISIEATDVKAVRDIGQWEFLAISDEEMVDTTESRLLGSNKQLTRIYYGTVRMGIDLSQMSEGAIRMREDTLDVTLPPIIILDKEFIDEARTKSFHESGSWDQQSRSDLYERAREKMIARCMTESNIHTAQAYAVDEIRQVFLSMGYPYVDVHF